MRQPDARTAFGISFVLSTLLSIAAPGFAQPAKFEDVVRNLKNPDAKIRISAVRLLREAGYAEAIVPMAPLVNDPINDIQLEAINAELAFFLVEPVSAKRKVAFVLEVRADGTAPAAFDAGQLAVWPKPAPAELVDALLTAVDDDHKKVRLEAIYTLGVIAGASTTLSDAASARLVKALDHYDPAIRAGAARVIGRLRVKNAVDGLLKAVNDSNEVVRFAAIRALGDIREGRAIQPITDQFRYYGRGEGAVAALEALATIAHSSSLPLFTSRIGDRDPRIRRAAAEGLARIADAKSIENFVFTANQDDSTTVRAAQIYALHRSGYANYVGRLMDFLYKEESARQVQGYMLEIGPSIVPAIVPRLQEPDPGVREHLAEVLGAIGDQSAITLLTPMKQDPSREVAAAATHAIERIKMAQK